MSYTWLFVLRLYSGTNYVLLFCNIAILRPLRLDLFQTYLRKIWLEVEFCDAICEQLSTKMALPIPFIFPPYAPFLEERKNVKTWRLFYSNYFF